MKKKTLLEVLRLQFPQYDKERLLSFVLCGDIYHIEEKLKDPKQKIPIQWELSIQTKKYVSRGGDKLEAALHRMPIPVKGNVVLDAGASTGGFTDCLLQFGAKAVHAVDVGFNQLDFSLRRDSRVYVHEKTNIMKLTALDPIPHGAVADLSFRSLVTAASHIMSLTSDGWLLALVKPQFEYQNPDEDFNGVIKDPTILQSILEDVIVKLQNQGLGVKDILPAGVKGRKGNQEFLFWLSKGQGLSFSTLIHKVSESLKDFSA